MDYDATLENWKIVGVGNGKTVAIGNIFSDVRGRWPGGTEVRTSLIQEVGDGFIRTLNTTYKLGTPAA